MEEANIEKAHTLEENYWMPKNCKRQHGIRINSYTKNRVSIGRKVVSVNCILSFSIMYKNYTKKMLGTQICYNTQKMNAIEYCHRTINVTHWNVFNPYTLDED